MSRRNPNRPVGKDIRKLDKQIGAVTKKPTVYTVVDMMSLVTTMRKQAELISEQEHLRIWSATNKIVKKHNKFPKAAMKKLKTLCNG